MRGFFAALTLGCSLLAVSYAQSADYFGSKAFDFIALGDMPYYGSGVTDEMFTNLIDDVNASGTDLVIHVGDTKGGSEVCSDERLDKELANLNRFAMPTFYALGDNEWTDCYRKKAGEFDPLERLDYIRKTYFTKAQSFGQKPVPMVRQADSGVHKQMVENGMWHHKGVTFGTLNIIGSNNGFEILKLAAAEEYFKRDAANLAWIDKVFAEAEAKGSFAVVLAFQADMFNQKSSRANGHVNSVEAISKAAAKFGKPVLVVYGDSHRFTVHQPLNDKANNILSNVTFLQVFGAADVHAVRVVVDPDMPGVFSFLPFYVPENIRAPRM